MVQPYALDSSTGAVGEDWLASAAEFARGAGCLLHEPKMQSSKLIPAKLIHAFVLLFTIQFVDALSSSALSGGGSVISEGLIGRPGTRYSSLVHLSKSISLHRSEQNGRQGLSSLCVGFPHVGHFGTWQK